jgi:hypothetical protein
MTHSATYKGYLICAFTNFDSATERWSTVVDISWGDNDHSSLQTLYGPNNRFTNGQTAECFIVADAKDWIDRRIRFDGC